MADSFTKKLDNIAQTSGAVLVVVPDEIRRSRIVSYLAKVFLGKASESQVVERHDASEWSLKSLISFEDSLQSLSLFSTKRCLVVKNIEKINSALSENFLNFISHDFSDAILILPASKLPKTSKIYKKLSSIERVIELEPLQPASMSKWLQKEFKNAGAGDVSPALINLIVQQAGDSLDNAYDMLEKLVLYAGKESLDEKDFFKVFQTVPNPKEFDLIDALQQKRIYDAEVILQQLLNSGKNQFLLVAMIFKSYTQALLVRILLDSGLQNNAIQDKLDIKSSWVFKKYLAVASSHTAKQLHDKLSYIIRTDSKLKNKSLSIDCTMGELLQFLAK